ncbi:MAG: DNA cytosine methyltransferase, partial [Gammaproteobacteria bacterium]|nr:DNA cytosine methyltransferase [Gammaproteobacteria bacterium]
MKKINTLALFSGGGGLDLGFSVADFNIILSSDIDPYSCKTLEQNQTRKPYLIKHPVLCEDVRNISYKSLRNVTGKVDIDFIIGGPPCQAFSVFGRRKGLKDPRGNLVYEYSRLIKEIKPEAFLLENVTGLKTIDNGALYQNLLDTLSIKGMYTIFAHEYEVAEFGVPQFRRRVFFIGTKSSNIVSEMKPTHSFQDSLFNSMKPFNTVMPTLSNL